MSLAYASDGRLSFDLLKVPEFLIGNLLTWHQELVQKEKDAK